MSYGSLADRFVNYRELTAKRAELATCGHPVKVGDQIGWHPRLKSTYCADCWRRGSVENAEFDLMERGY